MYIRQWQGAENRGTNREMELQTIENATSQSQIPEDDQKSREDFSNCGPVD